MIDELRLIDNIDILFDNVVILYGAGCCGVETLGKLKKVGMPAAYFCDGDPRKWGMEIEGLGVLSLPELKKLDKTEKLSIIITSDLVDIIDQIIEDIAWLRLRTNNVFTVFALTVALVRSGRAVKLNDGFYDAILSMKSDSFWMSYGVHHLKMCQKWASEDNVCLVYSLPKTGTSTMLKSLLSAGVSANHLHRLTTYPSPVMNNLLARHTEKRLDILRNKRSVKIICMVREPIVRLLSLVFYNMGLMLSEIPSGKSFVDSIVNSIVSRVGSKWDMLNWFDTELRTTFNIDIYTHPFDKKKGYSIIKQGYLEILVLKLEKLNSLEPVIADFVGVTRFKLVNENINNNKPQKFLYNQVKNAIRIPRKVFDYYYNDRRLTHFYTKEEIAGFKTRWENNISD